MGFSGRVCGSLLDSQDREGPRVVVQHGPSASGYLPRGPAPRPAILVRHLGSGVECSHPRPVCLQPVVGCAFVVHQPPQASGDSSRPPSFRPVSQGFDCWCLHGQYDCPVVRQETRGNVFCGSRPGGTAPSLLGGVSRPVSGSPIYRGDPEHSCGLPELLSSGPRFGMDPGSGSRRRVSSEVAVDNRSFRHSPQLPSPGVFLSPLQFYGNGHRCFSSGLGWVTGVHFPTFCTDPSGPEQAVVAQGDISYSRSSLLASGVVPGAPEPSRGSSCRPAHASRFTQTASLPPSAPEPPRAELSCVETVQQFARHLGLYRRVANQLSLCRRSSTRRLYQLRWQCYRAWCTRRGHSISSPSVAKIVDFLVYLRAERQLPMAAIKGYRSTLVSIFKFRLPELLNSFILRDLIRSFEIKRPYRLVGPPSWDLVKVLNYLRGSNFEPLSTKPLCLVIMKVAFSFSLATAKRVGELQALSCRVASHGPDMSLSHLPEFVAKTESERNPLPRSFLVGSLEEFVGDLPEECVLCPVRAVRTYLTVTSSVAPRSRSLSHSFSFQERSCRSSCGR